MLRELSKLSIDHPWKTLGLIFVLTLIFGYYVTKVRFETDMKKFLPVSDPAVQALHRAEATYGSQDFFMVLIETPDTFFKIETIQQVRELEEQLKALSGVDEITGPTTAIVISATETTLNVEEAAEILPQTLEALEAYQKKVMGDPNLRGFIFSEDGKAAGILIKLYTKLDDTNVLVDQVNQIAQSYERPGIKIYIGGIPQLRDAIQKSMREDLKILLPLVIIVMEVVLVFAFLTGRGVGLPFLLMVLCAVWTVGTMGWVNSPVTPFSFFLPVMLIVVSKAYAIYTVNRYYEEAVNHGRLSKRDVILNTMQDMQKPLFMDALAEITGFLALLAATLWPQQTFGLFIAVGVFYTLIVNFTLLPALLALLPASKKEHHFEQGWLPNALAAFGRLIDRRRGWVLAASGTVFVLFTLAIPSLRVETTPQGFLGSGHPALIASNALERAFGGSYQFSLEIDTGKRSGLQDWAILQKIVELQEFFKQQPEYGGSVTSLANIVRTLNQKVHADDPSYYVIPEDPRLIAQLLLLYNQNYSNTATKDFSKGEIVARIKQLSSSQITELTKRVNAYLKEHFPDSVKIEPVGSEQAFASLANETVLNTALTLAIALVAAWLIVALLLRSLVAACISVSPMILTIAMNLGTMSFLGLPLDLASLMIGSIAVGVGIDYTINFIIRWREEVARGHDLSPALEITMRTMGRGILLNAITLTLGFAIFYLSQFEGLRNFGFLINLTMIWSFIGSFTLIPALLLALKPRFMFAKALTLPSASLSQHWERDRG